MRLPIPGYEGLYEMDENSILYSITRTSINSLGRKITIKGCIRKPIRNKRTGYMTVTLCKDGITKTFRYHRLVAECFIPNPHGKPFVNHKNGDKTDNRISNLEWVTEYENTQHAIKSKLFNVSGFNNPSAKLNLEQLKSALKRIKSGELITEISKEYGVNRNTITKAINRELGGHNISNADLKARGWVGRNRAAI